VAAELWTGRVNMSRQRLVVENERGETTHKEPLWKAFVRGTQELRETGRIEEIFLCARYRAYESVST